jgi:hypothetical protein
MSNKRTAILQRLGAVDRHVECNLMEAEGGTYCSPTAVSGRVDRTSVTPEYR